MQHRNLTGKTIPGAVALIALAGPAVAERGAWTEIQAEINACVAAVGEHANYADAARVRHDVVTVKERTVGYKLNIHTSIYTETGDTVIREYATSCVVNGANAPMQFSISEADSASRAAATVQPPDR